MTRTHALARAVALVLFVTLLVAGPLAGGTASRAAAQTAGQVVGYPQVDVATSTPELEPGTEDRLGLTVQNTPRLVRGGPEQYERRVTTMRGVTVEVRDGGVPLDVVEEEVAVGSVPAGATPVGPLRVTVPEDVPPGRYTIPVRVTYSGTTRVEYGPYGAEYNEFERTVTERVTVRVRRQARFAVAEVDSTTQVGDTGTLRVTMTNVGSVAARSARVDLVSTTGAVALAPARPGNGSSVHVGTWAPGEARTVNVTAGVDADALRETYPIRLRVAYEDDDGIARASRPLSVGVRPAAEQTVAVTDLRADLRVGRNGTVAGTVVNEGPDALRDPVVVLRSASGDVRPRTRAVALPDLAPGERAPVAVEAFVPPNASAGSRQVEFTVRYRNERGDRRVTDPVERAVRVAPERDRLSVVPVEATFTVDTDNRLVVRVANRESTALRNVRLRLSAGDPFESVSSAAYVERLAPGESAVVAFELTVVEDAVPTTAPVTVAATADRPDGETVEAGRYVVPVTVVAESGASDVALLVGGTVAVLVVFAAGWWWLQR
ncbi:MAG: COG1361 S-layer family protein [Haloferacaceae archaeon]